MSVDLTSNIAAFWKLDEATGATRADSIHSSDLVDVGSVVQVAGKVGNAANFNGTTEYLRCNDNADLQIGQGDYTIAAWINAALTGDSFQIVIEKAGTVSGTAFFEWQLNLSKLLARVSFIIWDTGDAFLAQVNSSGGGIGANAWRFIVVRHDSVAKKLYISVNGGTEASVTYSGTPRGGNSGCLLTIGAQTTLPQTAGLSNRFVGSIDAVGIWRRLFNASEIAALYNGGAGYEYPFAQTLSAGGAIATAETFGADQVNTRLIASGLGSVEQMGAVLVAERLFMNAIASAEAEGQPAIIPPIAPLLPAGIPSAEHFAHQGLRALWPLDALVGGVAKDVIGPNLSDLTPSVSAPTIVAGKIRNAFQFNGTNNQDLFSAQGDADLSSNGQSFAVWLWVKRSTAARAGLAGYADGSQTEYGLTWTAGDKLQFDVGSSECVSAASLPSDNAWHLVTVWYDAAAQCAYIKIDGGAAESFGSVVPPVALGSARFYLGASQLALHRLLPSAIASLQNFGMVTIARALQPAGIATGIVFGSVTIARRLHPSAIASLEAFGAPLVNERLRVSGISGAEQFGAAQVTGGGGAFDPATFLAAQTVAYWRMNASAGADESDATGRGNLLIANPGGSIPGTAAGKLANARTFNGSSAYFQHALSEDVQMDAEEFIVAAWLKVTAMGGVVFARYGGGDAPTYQLYSGPRFVWNVGDNGIPENVMVSADSFGDISTGVWYLVICRYNVPTVTASIRINNGAVDSGVFSGAASDDGSDLFIGQDSFGGFFNGFVDDFAIIKSDGLSSDDFDAVCSYLWNGGAGRALF